MTHPRLLRHARKALTPLGGNGPHNQAANHALVHYGSDSVYSFIPKNGCSTMRLSLAIANGCLAGPEDFAWIHNNNGTFKANLRELVTAKYTFVILRCPFKRLASVFLDKIVKRTDIFWLLHRHLADELEPDTLSFRAFVTLMEKPKNLNFNIHWRKQQDFLVYESYDDVFAMERFRDVAPRLKERAGFDVVDARSYTKHGTDGLKTETGNFADTPAHELLAMRRRNATPDYASLYDEDLVSRVAQIYRPDIDLYSDLCDPADLLFQTDATHTPKG